MTSPFGSLPAAALLRRRTTSDATHVGIYIGHGQMVGAPTPAPSPNRTHRTSPEIPFGTDLLVYGTAQTE